MARQPVEFDVEVPKTKIQMEEERLIQIRNERQRLEKEIDILRVRYDERQRLLQEQSKSFVEKQRVDQDLIVKQIHDNKMLQERLLKTQSEVNQLRARIEKDAETQKRILLEKEVELDKRIQEAKDEKVQVAHQLGRKS